MYSHSAKVFVKRDFPFPRRTTPLPTVQYLFRLLESLPKRNSIPEGHCQVDITTFAFPAQDFESQELLRQAFAYCNLFFLLALVFLTIQDFFMFISFPPLLSFWDARLSSISVHRGEKSEFIPSLKVAENIYHTYPSVGQRPVSAVLTLKTMQQRPHRMF